MAQNPLPPFSPSPPSMRPSPARTPNLTGVRSVLRSVHDWLCPSAPATRLASLRLLVGTFTVIWMLSRCAALIAPNAYPPSRFAPVGIVRLLLDAPLSAPLWLALLLLTLVCGLCFALGAAYRVCGPAFGLLFLFVTSYRTSWGMVFHTENLLALHILVLAFSPAADTWSIDATRASHTQPDADGRYGFPVRLMSILLVLTYLIAGVAKLNLAGWAWSSGEVLRMHIAYDALRKSAVGSLHSPIGIWLIPHQWIFAPLAWGALVAELGAPLALVHRRIGYVWAIMAWAFHGGVLLTMYIVFPYPLSFIAYAPLFHSERWVTRLVQRVGRGRWGA